MDILKLVKTLIVLSMLIVSAYFASQYYVDNKDEKLKNEINAQINEVFNGRDVVCDGSISGVQVRQDNVSNHSWGENCEDLVHYYKKMSGGFEILQAEKEKHYVEITTFTSSNMGYKIYSYNFNSLTPSIDEAYKSTFNYLTRDNIKTTEYSPGIYKRIKNIPLLSNIYYSMKEVAKLNSETSYVHNSYYKVFYTSYGHRYAIMLNNKKKTEDFLKIFGLSVLGILLLSFVFIYSPRNAQNNKK